MNKHILTYGTANPAKRKSMNEMLKGLPIELIELPEGLIIPEETGKGILENARIKAEFYYETLKSPVFSCDSGLYLEGVPDAYQPGVHARRPQGASLSDDQMIEYYGWLAQKYGQNNYLRAYYRNGIALIIDEEHIYEYDGEDIWSASFLLTNRPHPRRVAGWPLDSLSVCEDTMAYYYDMGPNEKSFTKDLAPGFRGFFVRAGLGQ